VAGSTQTVTLSGTGVGLNQTITFNPIATQLEGISISLTASASSQLPVSFTSLTTTVCTVSGTSAQLLIAGTCTIQATQAGNATYLPATAVSQTFQITSNGPKMSQTITFGPLANEPINTQPFTVSATASSGLPVSFATTTSACTISGDTVTLLASGTCTIKASQPGNSSYKSAPTVTQSFTVSLLSQTITFGPLANQQMGTAPFDLTATASSGLPVSFASTTSACSVSGSTVTLLGGGQCTIKASQGGNSTDAAAPTVTQSFQVSQLSQTITFGTVSNQSMGAAPFPISATATSGLPVSFASTTTATCSVSGNMVTVIASGQCKIKATQSGNVTYAAAPVVTQSFEINQLSQTITFGTLSNQTLETATFTLSATASSGLPVSFTSTTTGKCSISGTTVTLIATGKCNINATQKGDATYAAAPAVTQSFQITN